MRKLWKRKDMYAYSIVNISKYNACVYFVEINNQKYTNTCNA